jgi:signal peptidase I
MSGGCIVTVALADIVGAAVLVAVTTTFVFEFTIGAVYIPSGSADPAVADHVTLVSGAPLTVAVNCSF